jgi:excisionase family DNA binding protein
LASRFPKAKRRHDEIDLGRTGYPAITDEDMDEPDAKRADLRDRDMMTVPEVADYLKVHPTTIYRLLKAGSKLGQFRVGGVWRFRRQLVEGLGN